MQKPSALVRFQLSLRERFIPLCIYFDTNNAAALRTIYSLRKHAKI